MAKANYTPEVLEARTVIFSQRMYQTMPFLRYRAKKEACLMRV